MRALPFFVFLLWLELALAQTSPPATNAPAPTSGAAVNAGSGHGWLSILVIFVILAAVAWYFIKGGPVA